MASRTVPALLALALLSGCAEADRGDDAGSVAASTAPSAATGTSSAALVLVLPATESLHPAEHARLLIAADRALAEAAVDGPTRRVVLPRAGSLADVAAALAPGVGALCAVGSDAEAVLAPVGDRRPTLVVCPVPASGGWPDPEAGVAVDLAGLGSRLGAIAREAAGDRLVAVVASGDPLLGPAWTGGVVTAASDGAAGGVRIVTTAAALAVLMAAGDVGAVVLDAGPASAAALAVLGTAAVPVLVPAALADGPDGPAPDRVAARYRVRWDLVLAPVLRRARGASSVPAAPGAGVEVDLGPAAQRRPDPGEVTDLPVPAPDGS